MITLTTAKSDANLDVVLLTLQGLFVQLQRLVNQRGGMIRQFVVDDKGCILIVCFGVPCFSHEVLNCCYSIANLTDSTALQCH
jgi:hypothetical protein